MGAHSVQLYAPGAKPAQPGNTLSLMEPTLREEPGSLRLAPEYSAPEEYSEAFALEDAAQFYTARRRTLLGQAFAMVRNHAVAEDLIQEAFARLVAEIKSGNTIRSSVKWTSTVIRNLALNHLEHHKVVSRVIEPDFQLHVHTIADGAISAEETCVAEEARRRLQDVLSQLAPLERECTLMFAEGYSYKEIAIEKKVAYSTAVDVVRRSLRKLRKQLPAGRG